MITFTGYIYGSSAHKHAVTALSSGESYSYDANGNMTTRVEGGLTYTQTFDAENRLISVTVSGQTTQFVYNGDGTLVKKIKPDGSRTIYVGGIYGIPFGDEVDKASARQMFSTEPTWQTGGLKTGRVRNSGIMQSMDSPTVIPLLEKALAARAPLLGERHESAFRLFNGFSEGEPNLVVDLYASTLVIHNYADDPATGRLLVGQALQFLRDRLSWLRAGIVKTRNARSQEERRGQLLFGEKPDAKIKEHNVWYAVDLTMNRDASFYLDTRYLRKWLIEHMRGKTVLNTFAYTGSLGVAALAGGAARVIQHDLNRQFLNVAKTSYTLNGFPIRKEDFLAADFFTLAAKLKRTGEAFDCVIIDPPFFSTTSKGRVDQVHESARLINKLRPLINDGGYLIAINNALYVSGKEYTQTLEDLCKDGYLRIREFVPVPQDFIGYNQIRQPVADPGPFNHSTKIAILDVRRKQ